MGTKQRTKDPNINFKKVDRMRLIEVHILCHQSNTILKSLFIANHGKCIQRIYKCQRIISQYVIDINITWFFQVRASTLTTFNGFIIKSTEYTENISLEETL